MDGKVITPEQLAEWRWKSEDPDWYLRTSDLIALLDEVKELRAELETRNEVMNIAHTIVRYTDDLKTALERSHRLWMELYK